MTVYENRRWQPYVTAWPEAHLLVGEPGEYTFQLPGILSRYGVALVHADDAPPEELLDACGAVYVSEAMADVGVPELL